MPGKSKPDIYRTIVTLDTLLELRGWSVRVRDMLDAHLDHEIINRDMKEIIAYLDRFILVARTRKDESLSVEEVQASGIPHADE